MRHELHVSRDFFTKRPPFSLFRRLLADESANALPEYAIVLASLSIIAIIAFNALGQTSTNVVTTNQNNFSGTATQSYQH